MEIKNKIKTLGLIFALIISLTLVSGYFTNTNKFYSDSNKDGGLAMGSFGLERNSTDFRSNGCGTGTMLDTVTNRCWQKDLNSIGTKQWATNSAYTEPTWNLTNNNYTYPVGRVKSDYPAFEYCDDLVLGGNSNWKLPSRKELFTLTDEIGGSGSTCTTLTGFGFTNCQNSYYRLNLEFAAFTTLAWIVDFNSNGGSAFGGKTNSYYVACVRLGN
jgi:hypothetical protein